MLIDLGEGTKGKRFMTKELKDISVNKIERFTFKILDVYGALYRMFRRMFGMVMLKLKK